MTCHEATGLASVSSAWGKGCGLAGQWWSVKSVIRHPPLQPSLQLQTFNQGLRSCARAREARRKGMENH
jgi:hypothetical protein